LIAGLIIATVGATTIPEAIGRAIPQNTGRTFVESPMAVCCADGAQWLVWREGAKATYFSRLPIAERDNPPDVGLFCRCVGADGSEIVAPVRIMAPVFNRVVAMPMAATSFLPVVGSDGGVWIFASEPRALDGAERNVGKRVTDAISVDRNGRVSRVLLDNHMETGLLKRGSVFALPFWSWFGPDSDMHCIYRQVNNLVRYVTFRASDAPLVLRSPQGLYYPSGNWEDSLNFVKSGSGQPIRTDLLWTSDAWDYSAVLALDSATLIVVHALPLTMPDYEVWPVQRPSDTIVVFRLHASDLTLVDSYRVVASSVAGSNYSGTRIPRAVLQRTGGGYAFFVAGPAGTKSYEIDKQGKPVLGERRLARIGTATGFDGTSAQETQILEPDGILKTRQIHWFGFTASGGLSHESSIP
jgi:hypothetical protein